MQAKATETYVVPAHGHVYEDDPHRAGLHAAIEGEEEHHEKKPVLKKVKEKVKKIKDTISKKRHEHDHPSEEEEEEEEEEEGYREDDEDKLVDPNPQVRLGDITEPVEEDPAAPMSKTPAPRGGEEIGTSPVIKTFEAMAITDQPGTRQEASPTNPTTPPHSEETPKAEEHQKSYTEKLKSAAVGTTEYGKKIASTVYDKVAGAGTAVMSKVHNTHPGGTTATEGGEVAHQEKGVSLKEYIAEKLKPGEEDKALSDVITDAMHKRKEETVHKAKEEVTGSEGRSEGGGVVEKIRGAVTSLVSGGAGKTEEKGHVSEGSQQTSSSVTNTSE